LGEPSGYGALAAGNIWQNKVAEKWKAEGYDIWVGWGHDQPDIVLTFPDPKDQSHPPRAVVSVKSYSLVPSPYRYGEDGRHSHASCRTIYREDVLPELNYAIEDGLHEVVLTIVNQRNGVAEHVLLVPQKFSKYTTSQRLNDDSGDRELVLWDLIWPVVLDYDREAGWERVENPKFDSQGYQIPPTY
jgi:hypothetical protein